MRILPLLTAAIVAVFLYALVMERDRLLQFARDMTPAAVLGDAEDSTAAASDAEGAPAVIEPEAAPVEETLAEGVVRVIAQRSVAQEIDSQVVTRGQTEALREVEVRAETGGKIASEPLRRGTFVEAGQLLCAIDPGVRDTSLQEAIARLAEAESRVPEARARLAEAEAQLPAARARIGEAEAQVPAAEARLAEARAGVPAAMAQLEEARARVPEAQARLAEAEARLPAMEARLKEAEARVPETEARLEEAKARVPAAQANLAQAEAQLPAAQAALAQAQAGVPESAARLLEAEARVREAEINLNAAERLENRGFTARTQLAGAQAQYEAAKAGVQSALSAQKAATAAIEAAKGQVEGARAGVEAARSEVASALAGVQSARTQIQNALAGIASARSDVEAARAGVESARAQVQNARTGIASAESQVEGASAAVETALSGVESARAAVISARAQLEGALAAIESARSGEENALTTIQSAQAAVASVRKDIERLEIRAPFAGVLETDTAELGALMQAGSACATVIQLSPIKIVGFVPEADVARIETGSMAAARLVDDRVVAGAVSFVSRSADEVTRTFRIELRVDNEDFAIRDGQTAEIAIEAEGQKAHLLPASAMTLNDEGTLGVRTISADGLAAFNAVTLLRDTREGVWLSGLPDTVDVITVGQEFVTDGVPVAPSFEDPIQ
ncbi:efflux RND transporter periplasmic adaptor subunit [Cognatishimia sp. F0-27]|uniref:efflux RND transporter periplasmic adaptor subunit n=1 Tax=Cognatishimia sp. F0-27 TaxID=2816855 RepID=UPI001D0CB3B1|nr:efflux RND transporter periplasmic adaptor subunit [Cognatishimia sp. F0-27]MCC1491592.1 efflux RND transporter periplasmic adaptor subunit [Cognatishimia sp. F0-27]